MQVSRGDEEVYFNQRTSLGGAPEAGGSPRNVGEEEGGRIDGIDGPSSVTPI
jgi:hypothetical protein